MPRDKSNGRPYIACDQQARRISGPDDSEQRSREEYTILAGMDIAGKMLAELEEAPIVPLAALLCSDASHVEIVRRLRLNVAIRMLCDAIAETDCAGVS
jgi:hypothetical protein